jgi:hypothetical protein
MPKLGFEKRADLKKTVVSAAEMSVAGEIIKANRRPRSTTERIKVARYVLTNQSDDRLAEHRCIQDQASDPFPGRGGSG